MNFSLPKSTITPLFFSELATWYNKGPFLFTPKFQLEIDTIASETVPTQLINPEINTPITYILKHDYNFAQFILMET